MSRLESTIINLLRQANNEWHLFAADEPLLVAVSGGKDSLALLYLLQQMNSSIKAVHVSLSKQSDLSFIEKNHLNDTVKVVESNILQETANDKNRCFSCSRKRRRIILEYADKLGIEKIAMGHHRDDVIETLIMNLLYSREISTLNPSQKLFNGRFGIIRPLYLVPEGLLLKLSKEKKWLTSKPGCNEEQLSKRKYIKAIINKWEQDHPAIDLKDNLYSALKAVKQDFLPYKVK